MARYVFLDRDGTLVPDTGYPHRPEDCALLPGVIPGLRRLQGAGYRLAIVTNQSGIGRGFFGSADFERFQAQLLADLTAHGIAVDRTYHCPHTPEDGCACRKPRPGMLLQARDELGADLASSWVIGDDERDIELAKRAGCRGAIRIRPHPPSTKEAGARPKAAQRGEAERSSEDLQAQAPEGRAQRGEAERSSKDLKAAAELLLAEDQRTP